jgi:ankyrin repeat protein
VSVSTIFALIDAGDAQGVRELLAADRTATAQRDDQGLSVLMRAAYRGGDVFEAVKAANPPLEPFDRIAVGESDGLPPPAAWTPDGFTPLHIAAFMRNAGAARRLLEDGADPNVLATASFARVTPLGTCGVVGATEVAKLLLEHGADPSLTGDHGFTPLDAAVANGDTELAELLRSHTGEGRA